MENATREFNAVTLTSRHNKPAVVETLCTIHEHLSSLGVTVNTEQKTAESMPMTFENIVSLDNLSEHSELLIIVGGDGSILGSAPLAAQQGVPVLGINHGRLGFLADIGPNDLKSLTQAMHGKFHQETRCLIDATHQQADQDDIEIGTALNDIVIRGDQVHMLEYDIYINQQFVCNQRADGLIIATPTGSTAYALSAGGPILNPTLECLALVPLCAHRLNTRPLVIDSNSTVDVVLVKPNRAHASVSCDGQTHQHVPCGSEIHIERHANQLTLIHPQDYHYYETLKTKLHWERKTYAQPPSDQ